LEYGLEQGSRGRWPSARVGKYLVSPVAGPGKTHLGREEPIWAGVFEGLKIEGLEFD